MPRRRVVFYYARITRVMAREVALPQRDLWSSRDTINLVLLVASIFLFLWGLGMSQKAAELRLGLPPGIGEAQSPRVLDSLTSGFLRFPGRA